MWAIGEDLRDPDGNSNAVISAVNNRMPVSPLEAEPELDRETR